MVVLARYGEPGCDNTKSGHEVVTEIPDSFGDQGSGLATAIGQNDL